MTSYKNLEAWKKSMNLVIEIYLVTKKYPKEELYSLTSQTKRAAISIPSNLLKVVAEITRKIQLSFCTYQEAQFMN